MGRSRPALIVVLLAAGQGTRMRSKRAKLLHDVAGRSMVRCVADTLARVRPERTITVIGYQAELVREALDGTGCAFALQKEQLGTGHAVVQALRRVPSGLSGTVLIVNGDLPTLRETTLRALPARR